MPVFAPGLVHVPVTPFAADGRIDLERYARLIDFHLRHGADTLALPMHAGESVSLTDDEQRTLLAFAIKQVAGRAPIIAHVSDAGTAIAAARARQAEEAGAAAIIATTPYYWTPPPAMILAHFAEIGGAVSIPFLVHNAPEEMGGRLTAELMLQLIARLPNFAGLIDASLDWQFMIDLLMEARHARPAFLLIAGNELAVSAAAIGATAMLSPLAALAPRAVRGLYELCRDGKLFEARAVQEDIAALRQLLKPSGVAGLKATLAARGRDCGATRAPLLPLEAGAAGDLARALAALPLMQGEPLGW
jgi:4-hydroxy-tetrahydrodipicolinate synthase